MRIFFVTNNYIPYSGGVVQSINATADGLRTQGHEIFIITLDFADKNLSPDPEYVIRIPSSITFTYKKNYMAIPWRPTHAIDILVQKYKPDIIHIHHPFLLGASALRVAHKYNIPSIFTYHTMYEEYAHYVPLARALIRPMIQKMVLAFCKKVDAIIAPSSYIKNYLQSHGIETPITIIPSPLRKIFHNAQSIEKINPFFFRLLLVTRFVPEKNIPFVFEVMNMLPENFHLMLVGYGTDYEKMQRLGLETVDLPLQRITFVHKPLPYHLRKLYSAADLFIFPSQTDTQAIVLAESMSQGVPVIALDGPGQRDIIINGTNGFIIKNAQQAAEHIISIASDRSLHEHLKKGASLTSEQYHAEVLVAKLIDLYRMHH